MSSQVAQGELFIKLLWIWISLLISMFVIWRLRHLWLKCHPPLDVPTKYSRRLSKRLKDCMVPESCDVILSAEEEKTLWQTCFTAAPARRREFEPSSKGRKKRPVSWPSATD